MRVGWAKWGRLAGTVVLTAAVTMLGMKLAGADFSPVAEAPGYNQFLAVYESLLNDYYRPVNPGDLIQGAARGLLSTVNVKYGDPYSVYMDPEMAARFTELVTSRFHGIGAVLAVDGGRLVIGSVVPGSPAQQAGIRSGDVIVSIDGRPADRMSIEQAVEAVRGSVGTKVRLELRRGAELIRVAPVRALLRQPTVYARMLPDRIGYILITQFSEDTAQSFARNLGALRREGARGLILDVRDNPGGLLQGVDAIASDLLPKGDVIARIQPRNGKALPVVSKGPGAALPMVCLINGNSASAAEVLAAALSESGHVPLYGERSFGKGTVQETRGFKDGSSLKLTVARWLTPDGEWIHKRGLTPNVAVPTPPFYRIDPLSLARPLARNGTGTAVAVLQRMLLALGLYDGRTDGYFDGSTERAVAAFQRLHRLPVTGRVDASTAYVLDLALLARRQADDPQLLAAAGYLEAKLMR